jgi:hypothetical protein
VRLDEKQRRAWLDAADRAADLETLLPLLQAAAVLAGAPDAATDDTELYVPLVVANVGKLHRRRLWEAWASPGRCGRWSALHRIGGKIDAHRKPERLELLSPPRPFIQTFDRSGPGGSYQKKITDPEDGVDVANPMAAQWSAV